jgi:hypothetical protein
MAMLGFILALLVLNPSATSASKGSNFKWSLSHSHSKQLAVNDAGLAEANGEQGLSGCALMKMTMSRVGTAWTPDLWVG